MEPILQILAHNDLHHVGLITQLLCKGLIIFQQETNPPRQEPPDNQRNAEEPDQKNWIENHLPNHEILIDKPIAIKGV